MRRGLATLSLDERDQPATAAGIIRRSREADEAVFAALAKLPPAEYHRAREAAAKKPSIRASTLDAEVSHRRPESPDASASGSMVEFDDREPWTEPVDGTDKTREDLQRVINDARDLAKMRMEANKDAP